MWLGGLSTHLKSSSVRIGVSKACDGETMLAEDFLRYQSPRWSRLIFNQTEQVFDNSPVGSLVVRSSSRSLRCVCEEKRREVGKRSPVWLLRIHDFMHAVQHNFEQLHISQETVISSVSTRNLIINLLSQTSNLSNHSSLPNAVSPAGLLYRRPLCSICPKYQEHSRAGKVHRSHSHPVLDVYPGVSCQCLSLRHFL
jgi:hypothetical protein